MQPLSINQFELMVLAKPTFDPAGLIVAVDDGKVVGFVHAGFGPSANGQGVSTDVGCTYLLMTRQPDGNPQLAADLLSQSEEYLQSKGAKSLLGGAAHPVDAFYLGLCGGSELRGVLASQPELCELYRTHGYQPRETVSVLHRDLSNYQCGADRKLMQVRRRSSIQVNSDPAAASWWEACTYGGFDRTRFELHGKPCDPPMASATFWNMEPICTSWGVNAVGLVDVSVANKERRQSVATYLLGEAFKNLQGRGVTLIETQAREDDAASQGLFAKLGFQAVDQATVFEKQV